MTEDCIKTIRVIPTKHGILVPGCARMVSGCSASWNNESQCHVANERTLLERAKQYDEVALGELYDQYAPRIYAYIYRRVGNAHLAEDLTGDVFVRVLQAIQSERFWHTSFQAWLYRIAHNLVVDYYRRHPSAVDAEMDEGIPSTGEDLALGVEERIYHQRLHAAMRRLTPGQQQVLTLRFGEGMTARGVAEVMEKSVGAVEALQHRGLAALRRILEGME
jgi:RNA polymerase sigma-70 factor (ECF subfamily)